MYRWWTSQWTVVLAVSLGAVACSSDDGGDPTFRTLDADPAFPGTPGDPARYDGLFQFTPLPDCAVSNPTDLGGQTELRVFRGPSVTDAHVKEFLSGLQRYYSQYGVKMSTRYDVIDVPFEEAMIFDMNAIAGRVKSETGIDIRTQSQADLTQAEVDRATASLGRAVFFNAREFIRVYGEPRRQVVNVVLLKEMVSDHLPEELAPLNGIAGLGLSPELLSKISADDPAKSLYDWLDVAEEFTPVAFVGVRIVKEYLPAPDVVIAHEVGHTYGLVHVPDLGNLMHQGETDCPLQLNDGQLGEVQAATRALAFTRGIESLSLTGRERELVAMLRALVVSRTR